ncbi:autotransporter outer membrane beta-barrel domain-containing protein [Halorubrum coriense]|uniref:hypothetical protein n=1 Tax=Halorubrum coriense TaxID=64713 RepID=UPI00126829FE|nr:hypothetical protein [Halorubrum coriense]
MNGPLINTSGIDDNRAVAPVIGVVILFGFLIVALSLYQVQVVPQQNAETEFQHSGEARNDLVELRAGILQAGSIDQPQYQTVQLGTVYSTRTFTINPPSPAGTIRTTDPYPITISNNSGTPEGTITIPTRFIEYQPGYNELDRSPTWYDASVLYLDARDDGGGIAVIEDQALVDNGEVQITALQNEFRRSGTGQVTLELRPAEGVTGDIPEGDLSVTVPTRLSDGEYWNKTDISSEIYSITDDENGDGIYNLTLNTTNNDLTIDTVGVQEAPREPTQNNNAQIGSGGGNSDTDNDDGPVLGDPKMAFDDANDNNQLDNGETTYEESELYSFSDDSVNLVIPESVETVERGNQINIRANEITSEVDFTSNNNYVRLEATDGDIVTDGSDITANNNINLISVGSTSIDGTTIEAVTGAVTVNSGDEITATSSSISANNNIYLDSSAQISLESATIDAKTGQATIVSDNGIDTTSGDITANNNIVVRSTSTGDVTLDSATVISDTGQFTAETDGQLTAVDSTIEAPGNILLRSTENIPVNSSSITAVYGTITIETDNEIDATGVNISTNSTINLISTGDIFLDSATVSTDYGNIKADLGGGSFTIHINETTVTGGPIDYRPNGVSEDPERAIAE